MAENTIALIYFSATDVTHTYARVIQGALLDQGCEVKLFNVTAYASRLEPLPVDEFDGFIFGFPVFADFAPSVINAWLPTLDGQRKKCAQFFTYGARTTGYAHFHTRLLLEGAGFQVLFSAEFLGRHSFNVGGWQILPNRPDEQDFAVAREYAALALDRFSQDAPTLLKLQKPFRYNQAIVELENREKSIERGWTHPVRMADECSMCRSCETECPTQAFHADTGLSDPERCIECMRCVYICPDEVLKVDERMKDAYAEFLTYCHLTEEMMNAKKSKIITESWQAAF
ncbi:MAG: 4Fe-4S binding protein [Anaerolineaceae bacterium]|nr:4Fe-4S binding protein [Anaerolineaceae bacterium]